MDILRILHLPIIKGVEVQKIQLKRMVVAANQEFEYVPIVAPPSENFELVKKVTSLKE